MNQTQMMQELCSYLALSQKKLAEEIGVSSTLVYAYTNGKYKMSEKIAEKIVEKYPDVNINFLLTGEGQISDNPVKRYKYVKKQYNTVEILAKQLQQQQDELDAFSKDIAELKEMLSRLVSVLEKND